MPTTDESVCCMEVEQVWQKVVDQRPESHMKCVTEHPGFQSTCLDVWVLETAYYAYRQQYGTDNQRGNEKVSIYFLHVTVVVVFFAFVRSICSMYLY